VPAANKAAGGQERCSQIKARQSPGSGALAHRPIPAVQRRARRRLDDTKRGSRPTLSERGRPAGGGALVPLLSHPPLDRAMASRSGGEGRVQAMLPLGRSTRGRARTHSTRHTTTRRARCGMLAGRALATDRCAGRARPCAARISSTPGLSIRFVRVSAGAAAPRR
jgi:hypothetical protein